MTAQAEALIASPHFAWMPGMRGFREGRIDSREIDIEPWIYEGDKPHLDDPATCGCLLVLVRKAWGSDCRVEVTIEEDGSADVSVYLPRDGRPALAHMSRRDTLGLALAAALIAAPKAVEP